jgi:hypothetical protein
MRQRQVCREHFRRGNAIYIEGTFRGHGARDPADPKLLNSADNPAAARGGFGDLA